MTHGHQHDRARGKESETGAADHIDKLAKRFLKCREASEPPLGEKRLIVRISVDRIGGFGPEMQPWS